MKRVGILLATALFAMSAGAFAQSSWQTTGNTDNNGVLGTKSGSNHPIKIVTNGIPRMYVANGGSDEHSGYIGINTTTPKQRLHIVNGNILVTRTSAKDTDAPGSTNGSILFGDQSTTMHPYGRWGIEYLNQDGATIENAECALALWRPGHWGTTGGIVRASDAVFRNNHRAIRRQRRERRHPHGDSRLIQQQRFWRLRQQPEQCFSAVSCTTFGAYHALFLLCSLEVPFV